MYKAIEVDIEGINMSPLAKGVYILHLRELNGLRRVQIPIISHDAQSIALLVEKFTLTRPLMYDVYLEFLKKLDANLQNIYIKELKDNVFYCDLIIDLPDGTTMELDCRPSDAICLAIKSNLPIFINENIFKFATKSNSKQSKSPTKNITKSTKSTKEKTAKRRLTQYEKLHIELKNAISNEEYEKASKIKKSIDKLIEKQNLK